MMITWRMPKRATTDLTHYRPFFEAVQEEFGDPDRRSTKIYKLRTIMQGDKTADEHVQSFKKAVHGLGYSGYALMEEFKCSLNAQLRE